MMIIVTGFTFLSLPPSSPPIAQLPPQFPLEPPSNQPPLITLDDYSTGDKKGAPAYNDPEYSTKMEVTPSKSCILHNNNYYTSENSDSDAPCPSPSEMSSEPSSAVASESDLSSAVASEPDLLSPP